MVNERMLLARLSIYRGILNDPVIKNLVEILDLLSESNFNHIDAVDSCHRFIFTLSDHGLSFKDHLLQLVLHDENAFSREAELKNYHDIQPVLIKAACNDLRLLQRLYELDPADIDAALQIGTNDGLTAFCSCSSNRLESDSFARVLQESDSWADEIEGLCSYYRKHGTGLVSMYRAFSWNEQEKHLTGISGPDPAKLIDLVGYVSQKEQVCKNTEQFLNGWPANNVLLYGSRGTGKSTMVKALLNEYYDRGLRLVEVACEDLESLPAVIDFLRPHSLKFIVFIDDLSFEDYETRYKGLKAVMEGSVDSRPANVLIYATSNRRHLVREFHSDRAELADDEVHGSDTMQEKLSLSDRFGLTVTFPSPSQQLYLEIVERLAQLRSLPIDPELLRRQALQWERAHHGPSGRTARQFVDSLGNLSQ